MAYTKREIKQYINQTFGFEFNKILLLVCGGSPRDYVMFIVCGNIYEVNNGTLNILAN